MKNSQKSALLYFNIFAVAYILLATITFVMKVDFIIDDLRMLKPVIQSVHWNLIMLSYTLRYTDFHNEVREYKIFNTPIIYSGLLTVINLSLLFILPVYNKKKKTPFYAEKNSGEHMKGSVIEVMPDAMFQVEMENGQKILAHISENMQIKHFKLLPGDKVTVERIYDITQGRITERAD